MRLIDADSVKRNAYRSSDFGHSMIVDVQDIDNEETVDAVPVVRCKDCKFRAHCRESGAFKAIPPDDWFCADGERKDGEHNERV